MTRVRVVRGDITTFEVDAIVNAANSSLMGGGGVDGAIHRAGGSSIVAECREIVAEHGECAPGDAVITGAGLLPSRFVIHTVGPVWTGTRPDDDDVTLASCYTTSLDLAAANGVGTIAFPNIGTGVYRFPKARATGVAIGAVSEWVAARPDAIDEVTFVCFDDENLRQYESRLS
ncbi:MAG: O-acetyl-ADP-ribose deacetylase [Actinomycetota bacterium]|nr:O-acetyl-ADP-ribose deacetylase [Actinomycetota bacterium]